MTHKQRMLAAIAGKPTDRIPWAPRLDLWYRANQRAGTLPASPSGSLPEMVDLLDAGFHAVIPNFKDIRSVEDEADRALGIYNLWMMPYKTVFENVKRSVMIDGERHIVRYQTPHGTIETVTLYTQAMLDAGVTISHVHKQAFQDPKDYRALGYLFENARVEPTFDGYATFAAGVGERGFATAFVSLAASPMHLVQRELMPLDVFFYEANDHPDELAELADKIGLYWNRVLDVVADCPAEVFLLGANYDAAVTYPPFFHAHIEPWLRKFSDMLHGRGKYLLTHTDGENTGLLEHYLDSGFDIADSICPAPMTKLGIKAVRDCFAGQKTIMGGIPSVTLLRESMPDREFDRFLDQFFTDIGRADHLILGISDTTPPYADFNRLGKIARRVAEFGSVQIL